MQIILSADNLPEESETIDLEIGLFSVAEMYVLNPSVVNPTPSLTINNYNDPELLTVTFGWLNSHDDWDVYLVYGTTTYDAGATSADPEITFLANTATDGTYDLYLDPYDVSASTTEYTISLGYPDQTVAFYEGTVEAATYDGSSVFTVVKAGTNYTVTHNN